jgi:hypothetical protein
MLSFAGTDSCLKHKQAMPHMADTGSAALPAAWLVIPPMRWCVRQSCLLLLLLLLLLRLLLLLLLLMMMMMMMPLAL